MRESSDKLYSGNIQFSYACKLFIELTKLGLEEVVISPGSRSTPLVLAAAIHSSLKTTVIIDERSAAFFALGNAKVHKKPIALVCTSGTAAAHYLPAIIEANLQQLPVIALTADRPLSLRHSGANQTINQDQLFGEHAAFCSLNLFDDSKESIESGLKKLNDLIQEGGPIQCNIHLDKPLEPTQEFFHELQKEAITSKSSQISFSYQTIEFTLPDNWQKKLAAAERPVFIAGPANDSNTFEALYSHIKQAQNIPIIAEQSSGYTYTVQERATANNAFSFLSDEGIQYELKPDFIISSGQSSTHKSTLSWLAMNKDIPQIHFNGHLKDIQNGLLKEDFLAVRGSVSPKSLDQLFFPNISTEWQSLWETKDRLLEQKKETLLEDQVHKTITEPCFYYFLTKFADSSSSVWCLGNSLIARDYDLFKHKNIQTNTQLFTTRGASGIDGLIAQAAGTALATKQKVGLIIGDVSFQHDIGSLEILAKYPEISVQIYVINNEGGRIFDRLPIKNFDQYLSTYYHTKASASIQKNVDSYGLIYKKITTNTELIESVNSVISGSQISEIIVDLPQSELIRNLYQS